MTSLVVAELRRRAWLEWAGQWAVPVPRVCLVPCFPDVALSHEVLQVP